MAPFLAAAQEGLDESGIMHGGQVHGLVGGVLLGRTGEGGALLKGAEVGVSQVSGLGGGALLGLVVSSWRGLRETECCSGARK